VRLGRRRVFGAFCRRGKAHGGENSAVTLRRGGLRVVSFCVQNAEFSRVAGVYAAYIFARRGGLRQKFA